MKPLISVIIPIYNVEKYLRKCLDSVISQTQKDIEVILVDDGSDDKSGDICEEYVPLDGRIKVIHKENGGVSSARNVGLDVSTGEYIGFVDGDDYIEPDMLEYLYNLIQATGADLSQCGIIHSFADRDTNPSAIDYYTATDSKTALRLMIESRYADMYIFNKLFRREIIDTIRFRDFKVAEDALFLTEFMLSAKKAVLTNRPKYHYYHRQNSLTTKPFNESVFDFMKVHDSVYDMVLASYPELEEPLRMRRCWARFQILDKMYTSSGEHNKKIEKELISFLRKEKSFILQKDYITKRRKIAYIALLINKNVYKAIARLYYKQKDHINP